MALAVESRRRLAELSAIEWLGPGQARLELAGDGLGAGVAPGRFAMVEVPRADCVLLRPLSYFLADPDRVTFLVKVAGRGTAALLGSPIGTPLNVLGPLGNAFPEPPAGLLIVAGGVGCGPWGELVRRRPAPVLFGARSAVETGFAKPLQALTEVRFATEDGSRGLRGTAVDLLAAELTRRRPDAIYCCGPTAMMRAVAGLAARHGVGEVWVSLEERMGCGFGVCRGCAHKDASGDWRCICEDGPVYRAATIFAPEGR